MDFSALPGQVVRIFEVRQPIDSPFAFVLETLIKSELQQEPQRRREKYGSFDWKDHVVHHRYPLLEVETPDGTLQHIAVHFMAGPKKIEIQLLTLEDAKRIAHKKKSIHLREMKIEVRERQSVAPLAEIISEYSKKAYEILTTNCWTFTDAVMEAYLPRFKWDRSCSPSHLLDRLSARGRMLALLFGASGVSSAACQSGPCCASMKAACGGGAGNGVVAAAQTGASAGAGKVQSAFALAACPMPAVTVPIGLSGHLALSAGGAGVAGAATTAGAGGVGLTTASRNASVGSQIQMASGDESRRGRASA